MQNSLAQVPQARRFYYGWLVVAVSTFAMLVTNGLSVGGLPIFFKPLMTDLGITDRSVIGTATAITFLISGGLSPVVGNLIGRVNVRALMAFGCVLLGGGLVLYARATTPRGIFVAHMLLGLSLCFASLIPNTVLVSNWFKRLRGLAMGIVITGTSLGGMLIPALATPLIQKYGWRVAMLTVSSLIWFLLIPAIWLVVRVHPREKGLLPDGDGSAAEETTTAASASAAALPGMTLEEAVRTPLFYIFALCAAMLFYAILAVVQQLNLFLQSPQIGMSLGAATKIQITMSTASIFGKLFFGWLSDRLPKAWVNVLCCTVLSLAGALLLMLSAGNALLFALGFGFGYGGAFVLVQLMVAECFGLKQLGRILGVILIVETIGGALGNYMTGQLAQAAGDYRLGFRAVFITTIIAFLASLLLIRLMPRRSVEAR